MRKISRKRLGKPKKNFRDSAAIFLILQTCFQYSLTVLLFLTHVCFTVAQEGHTCKLKMLLQTKNFTCKLKMLLQIKNRTCKLKIVYAN